ncbi:hypothetical protein GQ42DRAFT_170174 [Ramicandelaber brevisporus]|nr:hypothetical protein GQ42DRAFT_170174 [Ramicandelaber brevisporus]
MKKSTTILAAVLTLFFTVAHGKFTTGERYAPVEGRKFEWHEGKFSVAESSKDSELGLIFCKDAECKTGDELKDGTSARVVTSNKQMQNKQWLRVDENSGYIGHTDKFDKATVFTLVRSGEEDASTFVFSLINLEATMAIICCYSTYDSGKGKVLKFGDNSAPWRFTIMNPI